MELALQQRQEINLSMTLELRQAIELLQYSTYQLEQYIREQELENPLIELEEKQEKPLYEERLHRKSENFGVWNSSIISEQKHIRNKRDELFETAKLMYPDKSVQKLLAFLIYNLDDKGYLKFLQIDSDFNPWFSEEEIDEGIHFLQKIGPIGIGARNLRECLLLQVRHSNLENNLAECLIENHLELLGDRKWNEIASQMKIPMCEVKALSDFIRTLNPRPCCFLSDAATEYLTPDIIIERKDDQLIFSLNDGYLPAIRVNGDYYPCSQVKGDASKYVQAQYQKYKWLLTSIEQRRNTIIKIVNVLLEKQEQFFKKGFFHLEPLTSKEVAEEIGMHESTISRATANKVIQTSFGSFNLRLLFTSKLETSDGTNVSQSKVKNLLQEFIGQENKTKPYSDQKIAEYFNTEKGFTISRRTISKYREELRIPPSNKRKEIQL